MTDSILGGLKPPVVWHTVKKRFFDSNRQDFSMVAACRMIDAIPDLEQRLRVAETMNYVYHDKSVVYVQQVSSAREALKVCLVEKDTIESELRRANKQIGTLTMENSELKRQKRVIFCMYCDTEFSYQIGNKAEIPEVLRKMMEHERVCEKHPLVIQIAALTKELEQLEKVRK